MAVANALAYCRTAYYDTATLTAVKSFIVQVPKEKKFEQKKVFCSSQMCYILLLTYFIVK
jgi:hypothetical protein